MKYLIALLALALLATHTMATKELPPRYAAQTGDELMNLLITKGFAKEKEDNADRGCGCDCTCCQKRHSQYWINRDGALKAAREYVGKNLHLSGQALDDYLNVHFSEKWIMFDVLKTGEIEIEQMAPLLKQTMGDMTIPI